MTLSDDQQPQTPTPQGGGDQSSERSGRRRRRGRRGGPREEGQQPTDASSPTPAEAGRPQQTSTNTTASSAADTTVGGAGGDQPAGEGAASEGGERAGRNRRRNRNRNRAESRDAQSPAGTQQSSTPAQQGQSQGQQSKDRQSSGKPAQQQRGDQAKPEKKERPPRGSVLNRRQTRGDYVDTPKQKEEAPTYVPVQAATVEQYVTGHKGWQREVLTTLRGIIQAAAPDVEESIMWSQPVFSMNGPVCFIKAYKDYITFGFWRGTEISDSEGLLSGDLTMMRTMTLRSAKDVRRETFEDMVKQAIRLNREKGDPTLS